MALALLGSLSACAGTSAAQSQACALDYATLREQELAVIDQAERIYVNIPEDERTAEQRAALERGFDLLASRERVADELDLRIIEKARSFMASEDIWDREDDRVCEATDTTVSLFCALQFASGDVIDGYEHRRTALQEVRLALQDATEGRDYDHRLRDFNNDPRTSLADIWAVLDTARDRVSQRLAQQEACLLDPVTSQAIGQ